MFAGEYKEHVDKLVPSVQKKVHTSLQKKKIATESYDVEHQQAVVEALHRALEQYNKKKEASAERRRKLKSEKAAKVSDKSDAFEPIAELTEAVETLAIVA